MTNNAKKAVDMLNNPTLYLGIIVAMLSWFLPNLSKKVDKFEEKEIQKMEKIGDIQISTNNLNNSVFNIENELTAIKKKNEYIWKSVNDKLDIQGKDIRLLCNQIERYGNTRDWVNHPECKSK